MGLTGNQTWLKKGLLREETICCKAQTKYRKHRREGKWKKEHREKVDEEREWDRGKIQRKQLRAFKNSWGKNNPQIQEIQ